MINYLLWVTKELLLIILNDCELKLIVTLNISIVNVTIIQYSSRKIITY